MLNQSMKVQADVAKNSDKKQRASYGAEEMSSTGGEAMHPEGYKKLRGE